VSEVRTGPVPFAYAYTYDHNGNRLTQTNNGSLVQSFTYDAHDKLTSGTAGNESDTYDLNGSETRLTLGGSVYQFVYDEEDRLVQGLYPGVTDTFSYNGLGLRVGKQDSTGSYSYLCDGASAGSPVLWDGQAVYTAGLSERRGGVSSFYDYDRLGNLWTVDGSAGAVQLYYQDTTGFGGVIAAAGNVGTPFRFGGGNGCQTDADTGLVLMGHATTTRALDGSSLRTRQAMATTGTATPTTTRWTRWTRRGWSLRLPTAAAVTGGWGGARCRSRWGAGTPAPTTSTRSFPARRERAATGRR